MRSTNDLTSKRIALVQLTVVAIAGVHQKSCRTVRHLSHLGRCARQPAEQGCFNVLVSIYSHRVDISLIAPEMGKPRKDEDAGWVLYDPVDVLVEESLEIAGLILKH